ncbi:unnamed protein product [Moneuplotes crassus]|uniref:Uncharacterized protein n=1 Tax=Euplotes crassus TaxID=5936 RepID=A0AAD1UC11_EUPCR|nr:unnamed protein product [Moneuplotes crassus]
MLIEDQNRMFRLRQRRNRRFGASVDYTRKEKKRKKALIGRQTTLLKELKLLESKGKKKLNNLDKRDNDRAIKTLRRKIKEDRLKNEYYGKCSIEILANKHKEEHSPELSIKNTLNQSYDALYSSYKSLKLDETKSQKDFTILRDTSRPMSPDDEDYFDSVNPCRKPRSVKISFDEHDNSYSERLSVSPEERKMIKNTLFLKKKIREEDKELEITRKAIHENISLRQFKPRGSYSGISSPMAMNKRYKSRKFGGIHVHPSGKIQLEVKKTLRLLNPKIAEVEHLGSIIDQKNLLKRKQMAARIQDNIKEEQIGLEKKIRVPPKFGG